MIAANPRRNILTEDHTPGTYVATIGDSETDWYILDTLVHHYKPPPLITTLRISMGEIDRLEIAPELTVLRYLTIQCSELASGILTDIAPKLPLSLEIIDISAGTYDEADFINLIANLPRLPSLTKIDFTQSSLSDAIALALAAAMPGMQSLTTLYLSGNRITENGAIAIVRALPRLMTVVTYNMSHVAVGGAGGAAAAFPVVIIDLAGNPINEAAKDLIRREIPPGCGVRL
jgi:hypothetical protein